MKKILTILLLTELCSFLNAQNTFQKTYPFFSGEANGHLIITQSDGYIISGVGIKEKFYLFLIKTDFAGDTLWTKDIDLGLTAIVPISKK